MTLFAQVTFGSSGAPSLITTNARSKGIVSVTRNGTGEYTFVFGSVGSYTMLDLYQRLLGVYVTFETGSTTKPAAPLLNVVASNVGTNGTASLQVQLYNDAGTATDPASTETSRWVFTLSQSNAP